MGIRVPTIEIPDQIDRLGFGSGTVKIDRFRHVPSRIRTSGRFFENYVHKSFLFRRSARSPLNSSGSPIALGVPKAHFELLIAPSHWRIMIFVRGLVMWLSGVYTTIFREHPRIALETTRHRCAPARGHSCPHQR